MDITGIPVLLAIVGFVIWVWGEDIGDFFAINKINKRDALRKDAYYHFKEIED